MFSRNSNATSISEFYRSFIKSRQSDDFRKVVAMVRPPGVHPGLTTKIIKKLPQFISHPAHTAIAT